MRSTINISMLVLISMCLLFNNAWGYVNNHPIADPGGSYSVYRGNDLFLDGSGSYDPNESDGDSIVLYEWDMDNDNYFDDLIGPTVTVTYDQWSFWYTSEGTDYLVALRVSDTWGRTHMDSAVLRYEYGSPPAVPIPSALWLLSSGLIGIVGIRRKLKN